MPVHERRRIALGFGCCLGIFFDQWIRDQPLGIGVGLFVALLVGGQVIVVAPGPGGLQRRNLWLGLIVLWLAIVPGLRDAPLLVGVSIATLLLVLLMAADAVTGVPIEALTPGDYLRTQAAVVSSVLVRAGPPMAVLVGAPIRRLPARGRAAPLCRGLLLAVPFLMVFTVLLSSADVVFGSYVERLARLEIPLDVGTLLQHGIVILTVGWLLSGWLLHVARVRPQRTIANRTPRIAAAEAGAPATLSTLAPQPREVAGASRDVAHAASQAGPRAGFVEMATLLAAIDLLFGAFVLVQLTYLFVGRDTLSLTGLTYADYARRGFFELLAVATIALPLVVAVEALTRRATEADRRAFQLLAATMVILTVVILASAMVRMALYEDAYGYTQLRVYSHGFMIWVAVVCGVFLVALLAERRQWLVFGTFLWVVLSVSGLGVVNPDHFIAEQNLARYDRGRPIDTTHLLALSADAIPTMVRALDVAAAKDDAPVRQDLGVGLHQRLITLDGAASEHWPTWNRARSEAHAVLDARRTEIESYPLPFRERSRGVMLDVAHP
jgi:hypothetical protein